MTQKQQQIKDVLSALENYYPSYFGSDKPIEKNFKVQRKIYTKSSALEEAFNLAEIPQNVSDVGVAIRKLEEIYSATETITEKPEYSEPTTTETNNIDPSTLNSEQLKELEEKADIRNKQLKETKENAVKEVERARARTEQIIKEQKDIREQLDRLKETQNEINEKVYAKVEIENETPTVLTEKESQLIDKYKEDIKINPEETLEEITEDISEIVTPILKKEGLSDVEITNVINETSTTIIENLASNESPNYIPVTTQVAILSSVSNDTKIIPNLVKSADLKRVISSSAKNVAVTRFFPAETARKVTELAFGKDITRTIFGPNINDIKVTLSTIPSEGFSKEVDLYKVSQSNVTILNDRSQFLERISGPVNNNVARDLFYQSSRGYIERRINSIAPSVVKKLVKNPTARNLLLKSIGANSAASWKAGNVIGNLAIKYAPNTLPFLNVIGQKLGINFITAAATSVGTGATVGTGVGVAVGTSLAGEGAAIGAALGGGTPLSIAFAAIGAAIATFGKKIFSTLKDWWTKNKDDIKPTIAITAGIGGTLVFGAGPGLLIGLGSLAALGVLAPFVMQTLNILNLVGQSAILAIATPVFVTMLVLPPLVAFIILVINNNAYIVPPSPLSSQLSQENPYMSVTKSADKNKIFNPIGTSTIKYTVTITATKNPLTNVKLVSTECSVTKKNKTKINCPPEVLPELPAELSISPTSPYTFEFEVKYNNSFSDSLVFDTVEISADTVDGQSITSAGSASVCIGDCPNACVTVTDKSWSSNTNGQSILTNASAALVSKFPGFMNKVCADGKEVKLCYSTSNPSPIGTNGMCNGAIYARHMHGECDINFNQCGIKNENDALFILTHELSHHIQKLDDGSVGQYQNSGGYFELKNNGFCSYSNTKGDPYEAMAEANGLFASIPSWGRCVTNYQNQYPKNYIYARNFMTQ